MTKNSDLRSVRVEVEAASSGTVDAPAVEIPTNGSKVGVVTGLIALGLVALLIGLALRGDDVPPAGAEPAVSGSTTVAPLPEEDASGGSAQVPTVQRSAELFEPLSGTGQLQSVVRTPSGFLGLLWDRSARQVPNMMRSVEGVKWATVEVAFDDPNAPSQQEGPFERIFEKLIRTEDGYALVMTTVWFDTDEGFSPSAVRIERITSRDGIRWNVDPSFEPVDVVDGLPRVIAHGANSFVYLAQPISPVNPQLGNLLGSQTRDASRFDGVCWAEAEADGSLSLTSCTSGETVSLDAADTIAPERFDLFRNCAVDLSEVNGGGSSFWVARPGLAVQKLVDEVSVLLPPVIAEDGTVAALEFSRVSPSAQSPCAGFVDLAVPDPPALVVSDPRNPTAPVRLPVPDEVDLISLLSVRTEPAINSRAMLVLIGDSVTSIDVDTGEWTEMLRLPFRIDDETAVRFSRDGSQLVQLDSSRVTVIDLLTGEERSREDVGGGNRPGFPWMIYADETVAFAQGGNSMFKIYLPTQ